MPFIISNTPITDEFTNMLCYITDILETTNTTRIAISSEEVINQVLQLTLRKILVTHCENARKYNKMLIYEQKRIYFTPKVSLYYSQKDD